MTNAEKSREMQTKINKLETEVKNLRSQLFRYRKRDTPIASDFIRNKKKNQKVDCRQCKTFEKCTKKQYAATKGYQMKCHAFQQKEGY